MTTDKDRNPPPESRLLSLPDEILSKILALCTSPTPKQEFLSSYAKSRPGKDVHNKVLALTACKRLYYLAIDAHFHHNQIKGVLSLGSSPSRRKARTRAGIYWGTFEEAPVYFKHTRKLVVRFILQDAGSLDDFIVDIRKLVEKCEVLVKLVIDLSTTEVGVAALLQQGIADPVADVRTNSGNKIVASYMGTPKHRAKLVVNAHVNLKKAEFWYKY